MKPRRENWLPERTALLRVHYPHLDNAVVAALLGSTVQAVVSKASKLRLYKSAAYRAVVTRQTTRQRSPWNAQLEELLAFLYPHSMPGQIEALFGMSRLCISAKAQNMGIKKTPELLSQIASARQAQIRARGGEQAYRQARYLPGHQPWNTGTRGKMGSNGPTRYRKGNTPYTHLPVGTRRVRTLSGVPGTLMEKVQHPDQWKKVSTLVWERTHGQPLPPGTVMTFLDGNRHNLEPDNLRAVSRKEWALRVSPLCNQDLDADHAAVLRLRGALTRRINLAAKALQENTAAAPRRKTPGAPAKNRNPNPNRPTESPAP